MVALKAELAMLKAVGRVDDSSLRTLLNSEVGVPMGLWTDRDVSIEIPLKAEFPEAVGRLEERPLTTLLKIELAVPVGFDAD